MSHPATVFVIDDDEPVRNSLEAILVVSGFRVRSFSSAEAFLESHTDDFTGCLLVDLRMQGMSGLELHQELHRRGITLPTIFITGHADESFLQDERFRGATAVLRKPFSTVQLTDAVTRSLTG